MAIKIIHVLDNLILGGREKIVIDLCNNLNPKDFEIYLVTLSDQNLELLKKVNPNVKFKSLSLKIESKFNILCRIFLDRFFKNDLEEFFLEIKPDIVHTHSFVHRLFYVSSVISKLKTSVKHFHTVHTSGMYYEKQGVVNYIKLTIEKIAIKLTRPYLIAISDIVQENNLNYFNKYSAGSRYIPNGINLGLLKNCGGEKLNWNASDDTTIITYVSRISEGKNHITLLKAFKLLVLGGDKVKLYLAGSGDFEPIVREFVSQNNLHEHVIILGSIENVSELLSISDIGVFPSEYEGFGLALLEMMAMHLPVVVANNQTFSRLIKHKENGLIHSIYDHKDLYECIKMILEDHELAYNISTGARETAKHFSLENMLRMHENYYLESF